MAKKPIYRFDPSEQRRPRRLEESQTAEIGFPIAWVIIGGLAALTVIGLVSLGVVSMIRQRSITAITPTPEPLPTLIQAVPSALSGGAGDDNNSNQASGLPTPEPMTPTLVSPTAIPEEELIGQMRVGGYVIVANTGGSGVRIRPGPRRSGSDEVNVAEEDTIFLVLDGPMADQNQEDYIWWNVRRLDDGSEGWVVEDFIKPARAP